MFLNSGEKGKNIILGVKAVFENLTQDIKKGIEHCTNEKEKHTDIIYNSTIQITELDEHIKMGENLINNLNKLTKE